MEINNNTITDHLDRGVVLNSARTEGLGLVVEFWNNVLDFGRSGDIGIDVAIAETRFATDHNLYSDGMRFKVVGATPDDNGDYDSFWSVQSSNADPYFPTYLGFPVLDSEGAHDTSSSPGVDGGVNSDLSGTSAKPEEDGQLDVGYLECY